MAYCGWRSNQVNRSAARQVACAKWKDKFIKGGKMTSKQKKKSGWTAHLRRIKPIFDVAL
jgi:hypothetical protein